MSLLFLLLLSGSFKLVQVLCLPNPSCPLISTGTHILICRPKVVSQSDPLNLLIFETSQPSTFTMNFKEVYSNTVCTCRRLTHASFLPHGKFFALYYLLMCFFFVCLSFLLQESNLQGRPAAPDSCSSPRSSCGKWSSKGAQSNSGLECRCWLFYLNII